MERICKMTDCWKWLNSLTPWKLSMRCPYCKHIEWRHTKTIEEFGLEGCMRCRLIIGQDLIYEPELRKKECDERLDYRVNGRYD